MNKHFRRLLSTFGAIILALFSISLGLAENVDLASMDVDSLIELRDSINAELTSRPEASPFKLNPGSI